MIDPKEFIITRKRKKYRFALFHNSPLAHEAEGWRQITDFSPDVLEVGAGTGLFSVAAAQLTPDKRFVAIDVKADRLQKGARKAEEQGLTNVRFVRTPADALLEDFTAHSLSSIWVTFPDPFPKKRAAKHRLTHRRFLALYQTLLTPQGALYFKTDNHPLFDWSLEELVQNGWRIDQLTYDLHASDLPSLYKQLTTYEQRFLGEGLTICFVRALPPIVAAPTHQ
ncbi:MAG TPA: tRNA (guanosine(46)-N7)-methyltransferase TrmB [Verrucomicrobiae bacterium]|nr:tRNA (guanosine(46)-N7)-methyltransferase TrmB [Verrucomicrobiae bacterium]